MADVTSKAAYATVAEDDGFGFIGLHDAGLVLPRQEAIAEKAHAAVGRGRAATLQHDIAR